MKDYSIARSPIPIVNRVLSTILAGELVFALSIVLVTFIRDSLSVDATLAGLAWGIFIIKTFLVLYSVGRDLITWLRTSYFVINGHLIVQRSVAGKSDTLASPKLSAVYGAEVRMSRLGHRYNFGDIVVSFPASDKTDPIILKDVLRPQETAAAISDIRR